MDAESTRGRYLNRHVVLELLPAVVFFGVNWKWGLQVATVGVMIATGVVVAVSFWLEGRIPVVAINTLSIVLVLGAAGLLLDDDRFIKMRPTIGKSLFAAALLWGLRLRPSLLERSLGQLLRLSRAGWIALTIAWIAWALTQAVANEFAWRSLPTDSWVTFKTVMAPLSLLGYVLITRLIAPRWWEVSR